VKTEIETGDEIIRRLALKKLDRWLAELAVRFIQGGDGLLPLKFYPTSLQEFVRLHCKNPLR
jgi:hypothetical protein